MIGQKPSTKSNVGSKIGDIFFSLASTSNKQNPNVCIHFEMNPRSYHSTLSKLTRDKMIHEVEE